MILGLLTLLSKLMNLLPQRVILFFGDTIGWLWFNVFRFRREVALSNLELAFGTSLSRRERSAIAARNFRHMGRNLMEVLQGICWKREDFLKRVSFEGLDNVMPFVREGKPAAILTSHMGNWELAIGVTAAHGIPVDVVVKRARTPRLEAFLQWYRRKTGAGLLAETGTAKDILRSFAQGRMPVFVIDQFMGPPIGLPVTFFGKPAGTAVGLALLTEKRDVPIIPSYSYRDGRGRLHTVFEPPIRYPKFSEDKDTRLFEKTQLYNDTIETPIRRFPDQWLWIHRRWKAYRGEPRWKLKPAATLAGLLALCLVFGCTTQPGIMPTGIALPPDPTIAVPEVKTIEKRDGPDEVTVTVAPQPTPTPVPKIRPRHRRKSRKIAAKPAPVATPLPAPEVVQVINPDKIPFAIGERLQIQLTWMALPAGTVVMEVRPGPSFGGRPTYELWGNVLSSKLVDPIYHVDNTVESFVDKAGIMPYKFLLHMVESAQKKETRVAFDHTKHEAIYWAKRESKRWGDLFIDNRVDHIVPLAKDMYSAVYYARLLEFTLGKKVSFPVYENGENLDAELEPVANELVRTKAGVFQCWKLKLTIKINNVLKPNGDLFLWLSDDSKRYLVKFDAKLKLGSLVGNLVDIRERQ